MGDSGVQRKRLPRKPDDGGGDGGGDPDDPSSESSSHNSRSSKVSSILRRHLSRNKIKEADDIKIQKLPSMPAYRAWKNLAYQSINTVSGRPDDKAMRWAMQSEDASLPADFFHKLRRNSEL